jgi:adenine specific DNA methylase Mod
LAELIWDGKYEDGKKVAPVRIALPFQTIETVNESVQDRQKSLDMFSSGKIADWKNRLIWGDKKYVLPSLLDEFRNQVKVVYIDPPFNIGADFSYTANVPANDKKQEDVLHTFVKEPSIIEMKAYRDTWGGGLDSYLKWFYETVALISELLRDDGYIFPRVKNLGVNFHGRLDQAA